MEDIFLTSLRINHLRHLSDIDILLSEKERKHLILTGKNGSGKTSLVEVLREYFVEIEKGHDIYLDERKKNVASWQDRIEQGGIGSSTRNMLQSSIQIVQKEIEKFSPLSLIFNHFELIHQNVKDGKFMFVYFPAKRKAHFKEAEGPKKLTLENIPNSIEQNINNHFLQYLVNLKTERSFARDENDDEGAKRIDEWFSSFEKLLKEIYGEEVSLELDRREWKFYLLLDGYERFDFNHLSDGYSAIINIVSELLLRMEKFSHWSHEMRGVVVIDEIETHLHIALQKKILPFLTTFFPNIQFIVTSHSPFVLNSINNVVIFDLEKRERVEDMSGYSVESIIETYFDADQYSDLLKKKVSEYEELSGKGILQGGDALRFEELEQYFNKFPLTILPELSLKINKIRLNKIV